MSLVIYFCLLIFIAATRVSSSETLDPRRIGSTADDDNWIQDIIKEILWTETTCPVVDFILSPSERAMVNNLINSAYLGKNMYFSSVTQIQSPHQNPMGNLDSISIMKKRNLGINEANHRFQQSRPTAEFGENQKKFIQTTTTYLLQVAHILANGQVCFANEKLPRQLPNDMVYARRFVDVINTYIMFLNHKYQNPSMSFSYL